MKIGIASADNLRADKSADGKEKWGGAGWARIGQYIPHLKAAGHEVTVGIMWDMQDCIAIEDAERNYVYPDLIIMQRIMHEGVPKTIEKGRKQGQIVVQEIDDWYWNLDTRNEAWKATHPKFNEKENTKFYARNVKASDYVWCSTPWIAEMVKEKFGVPTVLLPNHIDVGRFTPVEQSPDVPTFGWTGSTAHRSGDLEQLKGIYGRYIRSGQLRMHHSGARPDAPPFHEMIGLPPGDVTVTNGVNVEFYPSLMCFDVGLVPLRDIPFNHAKSEIKGLEYSAAGIPFIASDLPSYRSLHSSWGGLFPLAKRPKDWIKATNSLLDYRLRVDTQQALLEQVRGRDIEIGAKSMLEVIGSLR